MEELKNYPFNIKDCTLIAISTGIKARGLTELRDKLEIVPLDSIYYHFWGKHLIARFEEQEYNNDFATWVYLHLKDEVLAERLAVIDPSDFENLEDLRHELVSIIDERIEELDVIPFAPYDRQFHFVKSQIVVFNTNKYINKPEELTEHIERMSLGSIFYHFIDARRRTPNRIDDFRAWLLGFDGEYKKLSDMIAEIDPYFLSLSEIRNKLSNIFKSYFKREG